MTAPTVRRPGLVTVVVVLTVIGGIGSIIAGIIAVTATGVAWAGILFIVLGLIYLAVAKGLADGNNTARLIVAVVSVIQIGSAVLTWISSDNNQTRNSALGSAIVSLVILLILYSSRANAFFASRSN
ncbi:hypothetical protein ACVBEQ_07430 [Nakamurella sp. GG22]